MGASDPRWNLAGLAAAGPEPALEAELGTFGQFVGDWAIRAHRFPLTDRGNERRVGEVHFRWILGGRAIQDVWGPRDPETGAFVPVGSSLRFFDTNLRAWRTTWISPYQLEVRTFIGRRVGDEIVMKERFRAPGLGEHWIFSDITPASFHWRAERRAPLGGPWEVIEEMEMERISNDL